MNEKRTITSLCALALILVLNRSLLSKEEVHKVIAIGPVVEFIHVPAGKADFVDFSGKVYQKEVPGFWISRYEITKDVYDVFLKQGRRERTAQHAQEPSGVSYHPTVPPPGKNFPVRGVSWFAAYSFGKWSGGSLPTYEEWCKAGFWNPKARKRTVYSWGNNGNVLHNRDQAKAFPTGSFPGDVSFYGVRNMTGAPTEWIDRWDGERFTVGMGYYFRGDRGQSFNIASSHDVCGFRIVLRKLRLAASLSDPEKKRLSALVAKLGAAQYSERNETQKQLAAAGPLVQAVLAQHMDSPDPEIRIRVGQILAQARLIQLRLTITITPDGRTMGAWAPVPGAENNPESM